MRFGQRQAGGRLCHPATVTCPFCGYGFMQAEIQECVSQIGRARCLNRRCRRYLPVTMTSMMKRELERERAIMASQRRANRLDFGAPRQLRQPRGAPVKAFRTVAGGGVETNRRRH